MRGFSRSFLGKLVGSAALAVGLGVGSMASASSFNTADNSGIATFALNGSGNLILTLTDAGPAVTAQGNILTAVLFNITSNPTLTPTSVNITGFTGSGVGNTFQAYSTTSNPNGWTPFVTSDASYNSSGNVGGEWAYSFSASGLQFASTVTGSWNYGVSSSGLGVFGPGDRFDTNQNLSGPADPDGAQFGLISLATLSSPPTTSIQQGAPLAANSVTVNLGGHYAVLPTVTSVDFLYGTKPDAAREELGGGGGDTLAPLPTSAYTGMALLLGLGMFAKFGRRGLSVA
jgi:hypothetical protein